MYCLPVGKGTIDITGYNPHSSAYWLQIYWMRVSVVILRLCVRSGLVVCGSIAISSSLVYSVKCGTRVQQLASLV